MTVSDDLPPRIRRNNPAWPAAACGEVPGLVDTDLTRYAKRYSESIGETRPDPPENPTPGAAWAIRAPTVPLNVGWLEPDEISPAAVFLASDAAAMVTGADHELTGGDSAKDI